LFAAAFFLALRDTLSKRLMGRTSTRGRKKKPPDSVIDSGEQEDDPNKLWCLCRKPDQGEFMIKCDECGECIGLSRSQRQQLEESGERYLCPLCVPETCLPAPTTDQSTTFIWGSVSSSEFIDRVNICYSEVVHIGG